MPPRQNLGATEDNPAYLP